MNKALGIIDALEAIVLEGKKVPFSNNVILPEDRLFELIDKIRTVIKDESEAAVAAAPEQVVNPGITVQRNRLEDEMEKAKKVKEGADDYAEFVLTNLQLAVTKMRKNLIRLENNIENGRGVLDQRKKNSKENSIEQTS